MNRRSATPTTRHLVACLLFGCTGPSDAGSPTAEQAGSAATGAGTGPSATTLDESELASNEPVGVALPRGLAHDTSITEVWLDPRASAAITLDADGGVRLWPALPPATTDLAALAPIRVPLHEPQWISFAQAGPRAFVIAAIDTVQSARVISIKLDEQGNAHVRERFTLTPADPLLEVHVFDGGDRLLALGVDHRLRLYDGHGKRLAELAQYGLSPWQLRLAGPPESLQLAMVLAGPTRLQRFTITHDQFALIGEPYPFVLDRGPNHNDLGLLPSGHVASVLRRPKAKTNQWSLELHDLDSGEVRVMWGEVESQLRARLYIIDDKRALLEDGSGAGFWVDLQAGAVMPSPFELPKELELLPPQSHVSTRRVELPMWAPTSRRHASVVAGLRAVPFGPALVLDPIDDKHHHKLGYHSVLANDLALDRDGGQLAMVMFDGGVVVQSLDGANRHAVVGCTTDTIFDLAFTDPDHLLLVSAEGAQICAWRGDGKSSPIVSELALPASTERKIRLAESGSGELAIVLEDDDYAAPKQLSSVSFTGNRFAALEPVAKADLINWPELDADAKTLGLDHTGQRYTQPKVATQQFNITSAADERRTLRIADQKVDIDPAVFEPSPNGRRIAFVHSPTNEYGGYEYSYSYYNSPRTLSVWSIADETPELLWSIPAEHSMDLSWSADGSRLALERSGRVQVVTAEGELVFENKQGELELEQLPDVPVVSPAP